MACMYLGPAPQRRLAIWRVASFICKRCFQALTLRFREAVSRSEAASVAGAVGATRRRPDRPGIFLPSADVARPNEISPQHLFAWRKAARDGRLALPADEAAMFVPVMVTARKPGLPKPL